MQTEATKLKVFLSTCGGWYLPNTAKALENRDALAALWITGKNVTGVDGLRFKRCWPFHLAMRPLYRFASDLVVERAFHAYLPIWRAWQKWQRWPECQVVQAILGYATEPFDRAEAYGALKVVDCPNSHPRNAQRVWQTECDRWCPGEKVPVPDWFFARMIPELKRADMVLCPSDFVCDTMIANGVPAAKCFVNPFGVDTGIFKPNSAPSGAPRFVCVGSICLRKGHQYLFPGFAALKKQIPQAELICVGPMRKEFRMEQPKWEGSFRHYKSLSHPEIAQLLQTCSVFVLASVEEGFARVILEAMAAGLPIIATYETGATTMIRDGVEGLIVPARDPDALARAMFRVASDSSAARRMGEAAHQRVAGKHTWQDYGDRLLAEYRARLTRKRP
jgi:glycosyltransferase involved in cell wall biosynthesis